MSHARMHMTCICCPRTPPPLLTPLSAAGVPARGMFCACSKTILVDYILPYLLWVKVALIAGAAFFAIVMISCLFLCCCGKEVKSYRV